MLLQVISVVGALMVLSAYGLLQGGVWRELNAGYLAFNIVGSLLLGVVAIVDQRVGFISLATPINPRPAHANSRKMNPTR